MRTTGIGRLWVALVLVLAVAAPARAGGTDNVDARQIIERAYEAAGGDAYRYPKSLHLIGTYLDFKGGLEPVVYAPYELYRVQPRDHPNGHLADGKIRVSSYLNGKAALQMAFDGTWTYDRNGPTGEGADTPFWRLTMGFGMIRFALEPGYKIERVADDLVDGKDSYTVRVTDPGGASAIFSIRHGDHRIVKIVFATPRGLHERVFSDFFSKPGVNWVQPGRVRSLINGIKEAEFLYSDFEIGKDLPDSLFVIKAGQFPKDAKASY